MMTLQKATDRVHVVVTSSHLPGWKENREAWSVIRSRIADITSTQQFVKLLDQLADTWAATEGDTCPFVDQLRSQVAAFVTTVPSARATHLSQPQPVAQGEAVACAEVVIDPSTGNRQLVTYFANGVIPDVGTKLYTIPTGHRIVPVELVEAMRTVNTVNNLGDAIYAVRDSADFSNFDGDSWDHPDVKAYGDAVKVITEYLNAAPTGGG